MALLALALLMTACQAVSASRPRSMPNVLLIVIDTLRADRLGCYGGTRELSPFLDELASRSTVFHRAYAQSSWTVPSVASLLTSRFSSQHRMTTYMASLSPENRTIAEVLHAHGYDTAGWSANIMVDPTRGLARGFDYFKNGEMTKRVDLGDNWIPARAGVLNEDSVYWYAVRRKTAGVVPTFLYFQYMETHGPYAPPPEIMQRLSPERVINVPSANVGFGGGLPLEDLKTVYDAEVASVDASLRELFTNLEKFGFLDGAVVIVTADHGEEFEEHGARGHGTSLYEELIRVPLLVHLPGQTVRRDVDRVVSLIDVAPTVLELAGIAPVRSFEGRSFEPLLADEGFWSRALAAVGLGPRGVEPTAFSELLPFAERTQRRHDRALVGRTEKLLSSTEGRLEGINLATDPGEQNPVDSGSFRALTNTWSEITERLGETSVAPEPLPAMDEKKREQLKALGYAG